jgi:NAD(P)-dependent dehydrogenase (short-subunit alcohol dehydrogenase family)
MSQQTMSQQTIVITGAGRGLGLELARVYCAAGHHVIGGCRNPAGAMALKACGAEILPLDMADFASIKAFAVSLGSRSIDVLYNSAGVDARAFGADDTNRDALTISAEHFEAVMRVNVTGPLMLVQELTPSLLRAGPGMVVNVSSQIGAVEVSQRVGRDVSYASSKAALNMVTVKQSQALAAEDVGVVCLHPGWLRTDMGGSAAALAPEDAAAQIMATVSALTIADTGRFIRWDGTTHPW